MKPCNRPKLYRLMLVAAMTTASLPVSLSVLVPSAYATTPQNQQVQAFVNALPATTDPLEQEARDFYVFLGEHYPPMSG